MQPRGPGTAWQFRMRTPPELIGVVDPRSGRAFGATIKRGLGTAHTPTAERLRDEVLGDIRRAVRFAAGCRADDQLSDDAAEGWRRAIAEQDKRHAKGAVDEHELDVRGLALDIAEDAMERPPLRARAERFRAIALRQGLTLAEAEAAYLEARQPGNRTGFKPLALTTVHGLRTAVKLLAMFMERSADAVELREVGEDEAHRFRTVWLLERPSKRAPLGVSHVTAEKHVTLLSGLWRWALEHKHLSGANPWEQKQRLVPRNRKNHRTEDEGRAMFRPEEAEKLLKGLPRGDRLGDLFRLALVTGCRVDELAKLTKADLRLDGGTAVGFHIRQGKTDNAARYVPVPKIARAILLRKPDGVVPPWRREAEAEPDRVFPEFPIREASGKAAAASQAFTRERRKLLGAGTDGRLALHSTRHTWRTVARRAGAPEATIHEIGGWAGERKTSSVYDHGLTVERPAQGRGEANKMMTERGFIIRDASGAFRPDRLNDVKDTDIIRVNGVEMSVAQAEAFGVLKWK